MISTKVLCRMRAYFRTLLCLTAALAIHACGSSGGDDESQIAVQDAAVTTADTSEAVAVQQGEATDLRTEILCDPAVRRKGLAQVSWTPADPPGEEQQVVVTIFKDGFESGAFEESKTLPPDQASFLIESVKGQAVHRWKVLTVTAATETASETARFEGPVCIGDVVVDQPAPIP